MHTSKQIWWGVIFALIIGYSALIVPSIHAAEKVLRVRYGGDISGIDPARIFQIENQTIALNVYNGLVRYEEKTNQIIPDLATKWDITDGGKTYTFHLRQGVTFHKGFGTFTAEDVKYSYERVRRGWRRIVPRIPACGRGCDHRVRTICLARTNSAAILPVASFTAAECHWLSASWSW